MPTVTGNASTIIMHDDHALALHVGGMQTSTVQFLYAHSQNRPY